MNIQSTITKKELCEQCKVHTNTLRKYLKTFGIETGRRKILTPSEVNQFLKYYNQPVI